MVLIEVLTCLITLFTLVKAGSTKNFDVVIVGAGASGIAAAIKLLEQNVSNIKILEAEGRTGGRILSEYCGSAYVDLGAEWCQEDDDDVVYKLARKRNILRPSSLKRHKIFSDGTCIDSTISEQLSDFFSRIRRANRSEDEEHASIGQLFMKHFNCSVLGNNEYDSRKLDILMSAVQTYENAVNSRWGSFSWYEVAAVMDYEPSSGRELDWNGSGFKTIINIMLESLKLEQRITLINNILLNKTVSKIRWRNVSNGLVIKCSDGTILRSQYIIFTPSVGVLRANYLQMFEPKLPSRKRTVLEKIGYGNLIKVVLHFPEKWWLTKFEGVAFSWRTIDRLTLAQQFPHGPIKDNESWLSGVYALTPAENNENTLIMWFCGKFVQDMESMSDEIILSGVMYILEKFFGKSHTITNPDQMIRSSWHKNPNFMGAYVFETPASRALGYNAIDELARPLTDEEGKPVLLFAGEGTSRRHYGLVRGAIESGYREADRILSLLQNNK